MKEKTLRVIACLIFCLALSVAAPVINPIAANEITYHGNVTSHIFHRPGCRWYNCKNCVAVFHSREEALRAGYRPCKICKP